MLIVDAAEHPCTWSEENFGRAKLGDKRRVRRVVKLANAFASTPGVSIPKLFRDCYEVQASYDFLSRPEASPDNIQAAHRDLVAGAMAACDEVVLLIQDTTTFSWTGKQAVEGLGPVGNGNEGQQGFLCHSVLAAKVASAGQAGRRPIVQMLGLADQQYHVRTTSNATGESKKSRHGRWRESLLWTQAVGRVGPAPQGARWIHVSDRESDIFEYLVQCRQANHGFVIRANQDRGLVDHECANVFEAAAKGQLLGTYDLELRARPGQSARCATLELRSCQVQLRPPHRPGEKSPPFSCGLLELREASPPGGAQALHWILLTDQPILTFDAAVTIVGYYSARWLIEEFHKAVKTGLGAERLQLEHARRLQAAIAIMSIVAVRLLDLREQLRLRPDDPAETAGLDDLQLQVLRKLYKPPIHTVSDVAYGIGRLGGHLKHNGPPGWKTLMLGMMQILQICQGVTMARQLQFD